MKPRRFATYTLLSPSCLSSAHATLSPCRPSSALPSSRRRPGTLDLRLPVSVPVLSAPPLPPLPTPCAPTYSPLYRCLRAFLWPSRLLVTLVLTLSVVTPVSAQLPPAAKSSVMGVIKPLWSVVCLAYQVLVGAAGVIAVVTIVIAGLRWLSSREEQEARKNAKDTIRFAIIALVVLMVADAVVGMVSVNLFYDSCALPRP